MAVQNSFVTKTIMLPAQSSINPDMLENIIHSRTPVLLMPSVAYTAGGGSCFISGDFDIEFDFIHNCPCNNAAYI
jgi:hypothetical protein